MYCALVRYLPPMLVSTSSCRHLLLILCLAHLLLEFLPCLISRDGVLDKHDGLSEDLIGAIEGASSDGSRRDQAVSFAEFWLFSEGTTEAEARRACVG